ncbi:MAG: sigma-54 dependent transcriptional regulator [Acetobacteraceae bacterium]|nr:sigma-54 dependent transcriptional regulator [Acetobacteraceae bacterium]
MPDSLTRVARVLLVEDADSLAEVYSAWLADQPYVISRVTGLDAALSAMAEQLPDLVLLDLRLPDGNGLSLLRMLRRAEPDMPVVCMTSRATVEMAVDAMRMGAADFLVKPFPAVRLRAAVQLAVQKGGLRRHFAATAAEVEREAFCGLVGRAPAMQAAYRLIEEAARSDTPIHVVGEPGTGKELVAEAVHRLSPRRRAAFVPVNLAALDRTQQLGALLGDDGSDGAVREAEGGTLFLDQLGCATPAVQAALLGLLEGRRYTVPGTRRQRVADLRLVTSCDGTAERKLRPELFHRLAAVALRLPPLRERGPDILALAAHFLDRFAQEEGKRFVRLGEDAEAALLARSWPGNVRELQNAIRAAVLVHDAPVLTAAMLPPAAPPLAKPRRRPGPSSDPGLRIRPLAELEREAIRHALAACEGNAAQAAAHLGITPRELARRLGPPAG